MRGIMSRIGRLLIMRKRPQNPLAPVQRLDVGTCGKCGGPCLFAPELHEAVCPCGAMRIPAGFLRRGAA